MGEWRVIKVLFDQSSIRIAFSLLCIAIASALVQCTRAAVISKWSLGDYTKVLHLPVMCSQSSAVHVRQCDIRRCFGDGSWFLEGILGTWLYLLWGFITPFRLPIYCGKTTRPPLLVLLCNFVGLAMLQFHHDNQVKQLKFTVRLFQWDFMYCHWQNHRFYIIKF